MQMIRHQYVATHEPVIRFAPRIVLVGVASPRGTSGESTENLGYAYYSAWNLNTRTNYGTPQAFAVSEGPCRYSSPKNQ